ncbi:MAG: hypothetical protein K6E61_03140 [Bacteroidales bacterium]|nr:hypothetical protein [Bacteroidales bacterium]
MRTRAFVMAALAALAFAFSGCKPDNPEEGGEQTPKSPLAGSWELTGVATKVSVGNVDVSVYLLFTDTDFEIYQKIGEGRYTKFEGTYVYGSDKTLSGKYSNSRPWGPYAVEFASDNKTLTLSIGNEADTYRKIDSVPQTVMDNLY